MGFEKKQVDVFSMSGNTLFFKKSNNKFNIRKTMTSQPPSSYLPSPSTPYPHYPSFMGMQQLEPKTVKLSSEEIFDHFSKSICLITDVDFSVGGQSLEKEACNSKNGFFIEIAKRAFLLTTSNDLPDDPSKVFAYGRTSYSLKHSGDYKIDEANRLALKLFESYGRVDYGVGCLEMAPAEIVPREGMKVYFAGFPLCQRKLTFHRGYISSVSTDGGISSFTIDGTVVHGHSGGPVAIQKNGKLYVLGIIVSQITDSDEMSEFLKKQSKEIQQLFHDITANRSTGIGKAIDVRHCYEMLELKEESPEIEKILKIIKGIDTEEFVVRKKAKREKPHIELKKDDHVFFAHPDEHGGKHLYTKQRFNMREFVESTNGKDKDSKFHPLIVYPSNYASWVERSVRAWYENGADQNFPYVKFPMVIGADDGNETEAVQIYFTTNGAHIRPKYLDTEIEGIEYNGELS